MKEIQFNLNEMGHGDTSTRVRITLGNDGISLHPEGMGMYDGDEYAPILLEQYDGKVRLIYWPDINDQEPVIVDMSGASNGNRQ